MKMTFSFWGRIITSYNPAGIERVLDVYENFIRINQEPPGYVVADSLHPDLEFKIIYILR